MRKTLTVCLLTALALILPADAAVAAPAGAEGLWGTPTAVAAVHVRSSLGRGWSGEVSTAVGFIDSFTRSTDTVSRCHPGSRCVTIRFGRVPGSALGRTVCRRGDCTITIERGTPVRYRTQLLVHELGHVMGLGHLSRCVGIMDPYRTCWVHLGGRPWFTPAEVRALRRA